ncbi:MAG: carboxymuconolactone decarboxylase family protein [Pseudomonadota bacterium]
MSEAKNPFEMMIAQAQQMAKAFNPALESYSPKDFEHLWPTMPKEFMEMTFGKGLNKNGLDAKTRLLITLAGLTMLGAQSDTQIRLTVRHLLESGASKDEIAETIAMMAMFAGLPSMNRAMDLAKEVLDDKHDEESED